MPTAAARRLVNRRDQAPDPAAHAGIPAGFDRHDYRETLVAHDVSFAWRHFQFWAEIQAARFEAPRVGNLDTIVGYAEAKYRFTPRFSAAVRWNQQWYGHVTTTAGQAERWGRRTWRLDVAPAISMERSIDLPLSRSSR